MKKYLPLSLSLIWIIGSTIIVSGTAYTIFGFYRSKSKVYFSDEKYRIKHILQTGPEKSAIKTNLLAEILGLSIDTPTYIGQITTSDAEKALLSYPFIQEAKVKKIYPSTLYIDYRVKQPIAMLKDFENLAIDSEGSVFPMYPFYSPKRLPNFYLGHCEIEDNHMVSMDKFYLAKKLLSLAKVEEFPNDLVIESIDISKLENPSYAMREIVLVLSALNEDKKHYLRLHPKDVEKQLSNYLSLQKQVQNRQDFQQIAIDLRLKDLAYIQEVK